MADLDDIRIFVRVAELESISRAARSLGMPVSTVSRRLSGLEAQLGVSILRRTTRRVTLTPQGQAYFNECQEPLIQLQEAERTLTQAQTQPEGLLRMTVPVILSQAPFLDFMSTFLTSFPRIRVDLFITNVYLDLIAENCDIAIRFGEMRDSSIVAKRLGRSVRYLVAAPEYLAGRKPPAVPADLESHDCVLLNAKNNASEWDLVSGRKRTRIAVSGRLSSRDFNSASTFVHRGHGIGLLPSTYCEQAIANGKLIRLLPRWTSPQIPVFAVYPSRKFLPLRCSVFLQALANWKSPLWIKE